MFGKYLRISLLWIISHPTKIEINKQIYNSFLRYSLSSGIWEFKLLEHYDVKKQHIRHFIMHEFQKYISAAEPLRIQSIEIRMQWRYVHVSGSLKDQNGYCDIIDKPRSLLHGALVNKLILLDQFTIV